MKGDCGNNRAGNYSFITSLPQMWSVADGVGYLHTKRGFSHNIGKVIKSHCEILSRAQAFLHKGIDRLLIIFERVNCLRSGMLESDVQPSGHF